MNIADLIFNPVTTVIATASIGTIAHILKKTVQYRMMNPGGSIAGYIRTYPYHLIHNCIIAFGCCLALHELDQLNAASAFFSGYMSNSVLSLLRASILRVDPNLKPGERKTDTDINAFD